MIFFLIIGIPNVLSKESFAQNFQGTMQKINFAHRINRNTPLETQCNTNLTCSDSKYREIDGSCNNNRDARLGQANTPLQRILQPAYSDGKFWFYINSIASKFTFHKYKDIIVLYYRFFLTKAKFTFCKSYYE